MEPMLYDTLRQKIQALSIEAVRIYLGPEIRPERMKNSIRRMARDLHVPLTVRRVPGGVIFWRSSEEDLQQAQETASQLQSAQRRPQTRPRGRRPRGTRSRPGALLLTNIGCKTYLKMSSAGEAWGFIVGRSEWQQPC
jgi:hypothetical protein